MGDQLRLMCVLAHPDDESLGLGGTLAKYAAEGVVTSVVSATRGERGWPGPPTTYPGPEALGREREAELRAAADALGVETVAFLDYSDGELSQADQTEAVAKIVGQLRRHRPQVVATFGPEGVYGHPDHIAISQLTTAAVMCAADPNYAGGNGASPHRVDKLYYRIWTPAEHAVFQSVFGDTEIDVEGEPRRWVNWPAWAVSAKLNTGDYWSEVWEAVACHRTQLSNYQTLVRMPALQHRALWGLQQFYRVMSVVDSFRGVEEDLFAGLR